MIQAKKDGGTFVVTVQVSQPGIHRSVSTPLTSDQLSALIDGMTELYNGERPEVRVETGDER
jgi:hypothetical protein